ncbi:hypothetical protein Sa4125_02590 [Aureimonas sp. SA4125]|uniref:TVP38/TMEM64 family protein n=1 Tax=Aureimonas sp. SA4125 TaxID=2826993 RepID=UPI001CC72789|nr:TVP38/TMEM64 family protein [Aureimonas sp. SA4125]BDA82717.1 hypothetical protein Sa4125_02590 [Aureimonas sp. SA4125]
MPRRGWILLALVAAVTLTAFFSGVVDFLGIDAVKARRAELLAMVEARPLLSAAAFMAAYALIVALSLPAASVMTLLGGFLFGTLLGGTLTVVAATIGATGIFLVARSSFGGALREKAGPLAKRVSANIHGNAFEYLLVLRVVPVFPFFLINILPALFGVSLRTFIPATFLGIIPGTFIYAHLGRELGTISSLDDLLSAEILVAFGLLGVIALLPVGYRRWKKARAPSTTLVALFLATMVWQGPGGERSRTADLHQAPVVAGDRQLRLAGRPAVLQAPILGRAEEIAPRARPV